MHKNNNWFRIGALVLVGVITISMLALYAL